jgi:hypothetical protein
LVSHPGVEPTKLEDVYLTGSAFPKPIGNIGDPFVNRYHRRVITLMHPMGQNGSIYLSSFVKALFEEINVEPRITTTDQAVVIEIQT